MWIIIIISIVVLTAVVFSLMVQSWRNTPYGKLDTGAAFIAKLSSLLATDDYEANRHRIKLKADLKIVKGILPRLYKVEDLVIGSDSANLQTRLYTPGMECGCPLIIYFHGGGFVSGDRDDFESICRNLSKTCGSKVLAPAYRRAPENPFPTAVEDAYFTLEWAHKNSKKIGVDPTRIILAGDSSGGNLAAVVSMMTRDRKGPPVAAQVILYPWLNPSAMEFESYKKYEKGYILTPKELLWFRSQYLPDEKKRVHPHASPFLANVKNLPPAIIITAEFDILHDEGEAYAQKLEAAGTPVFYKGTPGVIHGYLSMTGLLKKQTNETFSFINEGLSKILRL